MDEIQSLDSIRHAHDDLLCIWDDELDEMKFRTHIFSISWRKKTVLAMNEYQNEKIHKRGIVTLRSMATPNAVKNQTEFTSTKKGHVHT